MHEDLLAKGRFVCAPVPLTQRRIPPSPHTTPLPEGCLCGDPDECDYKVFGYPYCRPCAEHHRPPECPVDEQGRSLSPCGHPWDDNCVADHG